MTSLPPRPRGLEQAFSRLETAAPLPAVTVVTAVTAETALTAASPMLPAPLPAGRLGRSAPLRLLLAAWLGGILPEWMAGRHTKTTNSRCIITLKKPFTYDIIILKCII